MIRKIRFLSACKIRAAMLTIISLLIVASLFCIGMTKSEMIKFPININGDDKLVELQLDVFRQNPEATAANWLAAHGYNTDKLKFTELVAGLTKHMIQKYNEYVSSQKAVKKAILSIPVTLSDGKTVRMAHYDDATALDTVRGFINQHGIKSEEVAQVLLKELQMKIQQQLSNNINNNDNMNKQQDSKDKIVITTEIVFPVDFGNGNIKQFTLNPKVDTDVYETVNLFLKSSGILTTSNEFKTYQTILVQKIISESLRDSHRERKKNFESEKTLRDSNPVSKIVLNLVVDNETKRLEVPNHVDAESAAKTFAAEIGVIGKENENSIINIITQQILSRRKLLATQKDNQHVNESNNVKKETKNKLVPLFEVPVEIDGTNFGNLKFYASQRPKDASRKFIRNRPILNDSPAAMQLVSYLTNQIEVALINLGENAPNIPEPLITFPVKLPNGKEALFEYMAGFDTYLSAIDFVEDNNQVGNPLVDEMIKTLERALIDRVVQEARRYSSKFKVFSLPLNFGPVESSLDLYYNEPPLLAANAFCLEHSETVVKTGTSIALCTETVVSMLMRVLNGVENSNFFLNK
jgi:hypothetical protein